MLQFGKKTTATTCEMPTSELSEMHTKLNTVAFVSVCKLHRHRHTCMQLWVYVSMYRGVSVHVLAHRFMALQIKSPPNALTFNRKQKGCVTLLRCRRNEGERAPARKM